MPSKYVYTKRGKTRNYSSQQLENAAHAVQQGMSIRKASAYFGVPRSTIGDRRSGKHEVNVEHGRPPHIPRDIEHKLVDSVKMAARRGIGLTRKQVLLRTSVLCQRLNITRYANFKAGKDWWEGLKRRHPDVVIRKPEKLTSTRARMMNKEVISKYFDDLGTLIEGLNLEEKKHLIWNCDEMGKNFEHDPVKVVAAKGENCVTRTTAKSANMTIMACVNGVGRRMPPMFIVKGKTKRSLHAFNTKEAPIGSRWSFQKNGWMDDNLGERWFNDVFLQFCGAERPQLLILDGHYSHESLAILMRAMEERIHILALPPHTTHYLQPLDRAVFGPLNRAYNGLCTEFLQESPLHQINKWTFPALFRQAWDKSVTSVNIKSGFKACGIIPLDRGAIPETAFAPSDPSDCLIGESNSDKDANDILPNDSEPSSEDVIPITIGSSTSSTDQTVYEQDKSDQIIPKLVPDSYSHTEMDPVLSKLSSVSEEQPLITDTTSKANEIVHELNLSGTSEVLDISDIGQLFQLIGGGDCIVEPVIDSTGNEIVCEPEMKKFKAEGLSLDTKMTIESAFISGSQTKQKRERKQPNKNITKHRLLTSQDVINEKLKIIQQKQEKELKKKQKKANRHKQTKNLTKS